MLDAAASVARAKRIRARRERARKKNAKVVSSSKKSEAGSLSCEKKNSKKVNGVAFFSLSLSLSRFLFKQIFLGIFRSDLVFVPFSSQKDDDDKEDNEGAHDDESSEALFETVECVLNLARRKMDALLEKSTEKVKKEEEERREVLTESIKNEAERAETHARLRHEVRIDIAEDAKVSWYFEMLDDVGKEMGRCSDGSETSKFSKTFPESNSTAPSNDDDKRRKQTRNKQTAIAHSALSRCKLCRGRGTSQKRD